MFGGHELSSKELVKQADLAMYEAKAAGRNKYRFFAPIMQHLLDERAQIELDLRHAVDRCQLVLHFQPIINSEGRTICVEALLRWNHPTRGLLGPNQFIPLAEKSGLISSLGIWVLHKACEQLVDWSSVVQANNLKIAVNVSARQFHQEDFVEQVLHALRRSGANAKQLKLELTESMFLDDVDDVIAKMTILKAHGVSFALDDFGTGYSSLSYLQRLPLDQLKIDKSFVRDMLSSKNSATIVSAIVRLAHSLEMDVVAEGVETEQQKQFLAACGCRHYQGFLISRPLPAENIRFQ